MATQHQQENLLTQADDLAWGPLFGEDLLPRLAGSIMQDPHFAIVELVANCWDAGASEVEVTWPVGEGDLFCVEDNGESMSKEEFRKRWRDLTYNRLKEQGEGSVTTQKSKRKRQVFGRNGVGRHAMFYFADHYFVETKKNGKRFVAEVKRGTGGKPFDIKILEESGSTSEKEQGTRIWCNITKNPPFPSKKVAEIIGVRFIADPEFKISVNDDEVQFEDLNEFSQELSVELSDGKSITVKRFDSEKAGRTSKQSGVAYWVNQRLVGKPNWESYDGTLLIDARHVEAKRYTYVVDASLLAEDDAVKPDWSGFYSSALVNDVKKSVSYAVRDDLTLLTKSLRSRNSQEAIKVNRSTISRLPIVTRDHIKKFADEVQINCPTISIKDLNNAVSTLAKLEDTRTGYLLIEKLSSLELNDLDNLYAVLDQWSVDDAKKVLYEVEWRLKLVLQMEHLLTEKSVDELHQIQPLFDRGLWILSHEYDSLDFSSNRELSTVLRKLFKEKDVSRIRKRPDFVAIPQESSLSIYSRDALGDPSSAKVVAYQAVVILELKRPGVHLSYEEIDQAKKYAREIKKVVSKKTKINCYVLGSDIDGQISGGEIQEGNINIYPTEYTGVLAQAKRRLFHLRDKIGSFDEIFDKGFLESDEESDTIFDTHDVSSL